MSHDTCQAERRYFAASALTVTSIYVLVAMLWLFLSDWVLVRLVSLGLFPSVHWATDLLYVAVTAPIVYVLVSRYFAAFRKHQQNLERDRALLAAIVEASPVGIMVVDANGRITLANRRTYETFGLGPCEAAQNMLEEHRHRIRHLDSKPVPPDSLPCVRAMATGRPLNDVPSVFFRHDGQQAFLSCSVAPFYDESGRLQGVVCAHQDVTQVHRTEQQLRSLNRAHTMLHGVNKAIVRLSDRRQLLEQVCRVAVEQGEFCMAWVAFADPDTGQIAPVASAGAEGGYLESISASLADPSQDHGPVDKAIREGKPAISNDIEKEPPSAIWRDAALQRGYRSCASLPLYVGGTVVGAYTLYSGQPDFFDAQEIALLHELAADISFALDAMEREDHRRAAEQEVTKLSYALEQAPSIVMITDASGRIEYVNRAFTEITGYAPEEVVGRPAGDLGEQAPEEARRMWEAIRAGADWSGEFLNTKKNGERFRAIFEQAAVGMALVSLDGWLLRVNQELADILGYPQQELLNCYLQDLTYTDDLSADTTNVHRLLRGEIPSYSVEQRCVRKDGTLLWTSITVSLLHEPSGAPQAFLTVIADISQRKQAEEALRRSEASLALAQQVAKLGSWELDLATGTRTWSQEMCRLTGREPPVGPPDPREILALVHPEDRQILLHGLSRAEQSEEPISLELRTNPEHGPPQYALFTVQATRDAEGRVVGFRGTLQDITERKELSLQLAQAQKMEAIGRLAGGIAHDFNNLLTAITGYAELSLMRMDENDPARPDLEQIRNAARRAAALTQQLLAFSRKQVLQPKVLDLNSLIADSAKMLQRVIGEDIQLETILAPNLGRVRADAAQLHQVIMNLAVNARDAMPSGGRLTIQTRNEELTPNDPKRRPYMTPGSYVVLTITDTGVGMDPETLAHAFEPFFTTKAEGEGTGLGLATVYGIIKQSGGYVHVYSQPGSGTTFEIHLPRLDHPPNQVEEAPEPGQALRGAETILLVEDEGAVRELAQRVLTDQGYTVLSAASGPEALRLAAEHAPVIALVLTDVVMPGTSGPELVEELRPLCPRAKVLFMSGYTNAEIARRGGLEEDAAFLPKPFSPLDLARKVREVLDQP